MRAVTELTYLQLPPGSQPPDIGLGPFRAAVIVEASVSDDWRQRISKWLIDNRCLYMSAWGADCAKWDESVDRANLEDYAYGDIPDERFVFTSWHEKETLSDALFFVLYCARHPTVELEHTLIVHISNESREAYMLEQCAWLGKEYGPPEE